MSLSALLEDRAAAGQPVRVGLIGAGKLGTLFLAQARRTPGLHVAAVADSDPERGATALALAQWPPAKAVARIKALEQQMYQHARDLEFEDAARLRDQIQRLKEASLGG